MFEAGPKQAGGRGAGGRDIRLQERTFLARGVSHGRGAAVLSFRQARVGRVEVQEVAAAGKLDEVMPRDPVAHPAFRPRAEGAAAPIFQLLEEPLPAAMGAENTHPLISAKMQVDIAMFLEAVSSAYPEPGDPGLRRVLPSRPARAAKPYLYVPEGDDEEGAAGGRPAASGTVAVRRVPVEDARAVQAAHLENERRAFHELMDRIESGPLEALDRPLEELDERSYERARVVAAYDPVLDRVAGEANGVPVAEKAVAEHERELIEAVIEPLEPMAKPRLPVLPEELAAAVQVRLSPFQRAQLARPKMVRDRNGMLAPVTYSLGPKGTR